MKLVKEVVIEEVVKTNIMNAPFTIRCGRDEDAQTFTFDKEALKRHGIPRSVEPGRILVCTLRTRRIPRHRKNIWRGHIDERKIHDDDLLITHLKKTWVSMGTVATTDRSRYVRIECCLKLKSMDSGGGSFSIAHCPDYRYTVALTEEEYRACKKLPLANTMFRISFTLKPKGK